MTHRQTHSDAETRNILSRLFVLFDILDTAGLDCRQAISSNVSDYEDAVMIETARRTGMDCIITRNEKDYAHADIPVYTPEAFIALLSSEEETDF